MSAEAARVQDSVDGLSPANFRRLAAFIQDYSGIKMPPAKQTMLEGRLRRRVREHGLTSLNAYCDMLFEQGALDAEAIHLIDVVTTNKTDFFREPAHFDFVVKTALPEFVGEGRRKIKIWSAACSIGAEPYTLAMLLEDFCRERRGLDYSILATDLSSQVLEQARLGIYAEAMIEPVPMDLRRRYVRQSRNKGAQQVRIAAQLRAKLAFARLNLMDERYAAPGEMDIIFVRNILIYFDKPTQAAVLKRLCSHLRPGGYLFLGHSETLVGLDLPVRTMAGTVFQKV